MARLRKGSVYILIPYNEYEEKIEKMQVDFAI